MLAKCFWLEKIRTVSNLTPELMYSTIIFSVFLKDFLKDLSCHDHKSHILHGMSKFLVLCKELACPRDNFQAYYFFLRVATGQGKE